MGGFNTEGLVDLLNALHAFAVMLSGLLGVVLMIKCLQRTLWATQMGGMNSMGTRSFSGEAMRYFFGSVVSLNAAWVLSSFSRDILGISEDYSWVPVQADQQNSIEFVGMFLISTFKLIGFFMIVTAGNKITQIGEGGVTGGSVFWQLVIGALCTQMVWLNQAIQFLTPFNPLGLVLPGSSVITIN
jgi:hypothetical protein